MSAPTTPTGLIASNVTSSSLTLSWDQSTNPGTVMVTGPTAGAWFGWGGGTKTDIVSAEATLGRTVDFYRTYYNMSGKPSDTFPTKADEVMYSGGKLPSGTRTAGGRLAVWGLTTKVGGGTNPSRAGLLANITPVGSSADYGGNGTNNVYTYAQITGGGLDAYWEAEFTRVKAWGAPCWFTFDWEPTRNKRAVNVGGGGGNSPDRAAAGTLTEFVAAWQHIHFVASNLGATNISWLLTYGTGDKDLTVYQAAYPGDEYVDWVGWSPYNNPAPGEQWDDFPTTVDKNTAITVTTPALGEDTKPVMLAETGCNYDPADPTHRATWLGGIVTGLSSLSTVKALAYWNDNSGKNFAKLNVATYADSKWASTDTADVNAWVALQTEAAKTELNKSHTEGGTGVDGYRIYVDDGLLAATTSASTTTTVDLTGYEPGSTHTFTVTAVDTSVDPLESAVSTVLPVTLLSSQPIAPTTPLDVSATVISDTLIRVAWAQSASRGSGVGGYRLYVEGQLHVEIKPASTTSYTVAGLTESTSYDFTVSAGDITLGVWSTLSSTVAATTAATESIPSPDGPAFLNVSMDVAEHTNSPQALLVWSPVHSSSVIGYNIYRDDALITKVSATTWQYEDIGLRPSTDYSYAVAAFNSAKIESVYATATATSPQPSSSAPLAALTVTPTTGVAPLTVTADASASVDPAANALMFTFDFGDGPAIGPTTDTVLANTYVTPGDYVVKVTVTNRPYFYADTTSIPISVGTGGDRTDELNLYLPRPGDLITSKQFWDQIRSDLRTIDQAIYDLRNP